MVRSDDEHGTGLWHELLIDNLALTRVMAGVIGLTQLVFLAIDPWVVEGSDQPSARAALPWLTITRVGAILLCLTLWMARRRTRPRIARERVALAWVAAWLGAIFACMALLIGFSGWFQPTPGFFVAAVLFLGLTVKLPTRWSAAVFAAGLAGGLAPAIAAPGGSIADRASEVVNMSLMAIAGFGTAHIAFRRRVQAYRDAQTIARQHAELAAANKRLSDALTVAEENRVQALAAGNAKSAFLARMSHEIRTPLHAIIGMTELMLTEDSTPVEHGQLAVVYDSASALLKIVNDVLEFSRLDAAPPRPEVVRFDIAELVRNIVTAFTPVATKRGATLTYGSSAASVWCVSDPGRIRQVVSNLVDNALKFSPAGCVAVRCFDQFNQATARELVLEVADTGVGIPADRLAAIFEPFEQADTSIAGRFGGTGLGLAISSQLVKMMGGRLTVTSELGQGSTFRVALPVPAEPRSPPTDSASDHASLASGVCLSVLIVDDTPLNAMLARRILQRAGHRVREVGSGAEALVAMAAESFDVVFMDIQMPEMDGIETTRRWQAVARGSSRAHVAVVAVTAHSEEEVTAVAGDALFAGYLCKPFTGPQLIDALVRVTQRSNVATVEG